ncbi:MAG: hypothetical protein IK031_03040 [Bacteroidales bacterium]|nr:hypothetical protein [Bacteroidales bacterium]
MKKILSFIAGAALVLGLASCNVKIENPKASNFVGTWDLNTIETTATSGSVTTTPVKTLDYLVITENTITFYENGKQTESGQFDVKDNVIYVDGLSYFNVEKLTLKEMVLSQDPLLGILVSKYTYYYTKR